jgi:hypothetical protein
LYNGLPWPTPPSPSGGHLWRGDGTPPPLFCTPLLPPLSCELPPLRRNRSPWRVPTMPPPCLASYRIRPMQERAGVGARDQQRRIPADRPAQRRYFLVLQVGVGSAVSASLARQIENAEFNCHSHRLRAPNPVRTDRMPRDLDTLSRHPLKRYAWCFLPLRFPPRPQASGKSPQFPTPVFPHRKDDAKIPARDLR